MKLINIKLAFVVAAMFCSTMASQAVLVTIVDVPLTSASFTVSWSESAPGVLPEIFPPPSGLYDAGATDNGTDIFATFVHPILANDSFSILFGGTRAFSDATLDGFNGVQVFPVAGNEFAAQFVYGESIPEPGHGVPDGGSPWIMLGVVCVALTAAKCTPLRRGKSAAAFAWTGNRS